MKWKVRKVKIRGRDGTEKDWVITECPHCHRENWLSFEYIYCVLKLIGECEDAKYPNGEGRHMVTHFCVSTIEEEKTFEELRSQYEIPTRNNASPN